jgi:hypothetical protein
MKLRIHLACFTLFVLILPGCNKDKPAPATTSDNSQQRPAAAPAPEPEPPAAAPAPEPEPPASKAPKQSAAVKPPVVEEPPPKPPAPPPPVVIPAGTVITVRLDQPVGSKTSKQGDPFEATLSEPVAIDGKAVIPAGSVAAGKVTEAHAAGRFKGGATLDLTLERVIVHGAPYRVETEAITQESKGKGKRTATMIGGAAGAGALIGGLAGGGKGAAIGGLVGAGAGTAGAAFTGGDRDITLPAEAVVAFQMKAPLTLKPTVGNKTPR